MGRIPKWTLDLYKLNTVTSPTTIPIQRSPTGYIMKINTDVHVRPSAHPMSNVLSWLLKSMWLQVAVWMVMTSHFSPSWAETQRSPSTLQKQLRTWFTGIQKRIQNVQKKIPTASKKERFGYLLKLAKEYEKVVRFHTLMVKRATTYRGTRHFTQMRGVYMEAAKQTALFRIHAAQVYQRLLSEYPQHPQLCAVYHGLGHQLLKLNQIQLAVKMYSELLKKYPKQSCRYGAKAHFVRGEFWMKHKQWKKAYSAFSQVLHFKSSPTTAWAHYKKSLAAYHQNQYKISERSLLQAVTYIRKASSNALPTTITSLERKIQNLIVLVCSKQCIPSQAQSFFQKMMPNRTLRLLKQLQRVYVQEKKYTQLFRLIQARQKSLALPEKATYQWTLVQLKKRYSSFKVFKKALRRWEQMLQKLRARPNTKQLQEMEEKAHQLLVRWGKKLHKKNALQEAVYLYKQDIRVFPRKSRSSGTLFWIAEVYMKRSAFLKAAQTYKQFVRQTPRHTFSEHAGYNAVVALHKALRAAPVTSRDTLKTALFQTLTQYLQRFPKGPHTLRVLKAYTHLSLRHKKAKQAESYVLRMLPKYAKNKKMRYIAQSILVHYQQKKKWDAFVQWSQRLGRHPSWTKKEAGRWFRGAAYFMQFEQCKKINQQQKTARAAQCFMNLTYAFANNPRQATLALYNSLILFSRLSSFEARQNTRKLHTLLLKRYAATQAGRALLKKLHIPFPTTRPHSPSNRR